MDIFSDDLFSSYLSCLLTQGLLHLLNEIGYPGHVCAESIPILKLCVDLIEAVESEGYFYTNDIKVNSHNFVFIYFASEITV